MCINTDTFKSLSKKWPIKSVCNLVTKLSNLLKRKDIEQFMCIVCLESSTTKNIIYCESNHHQICKKCVQEMAKNHIYSISYQTIIKGFPCPGFKCNDHFSYETCGKFLSKKIQKQIQSKINEAMLMMANIEFEKCRKCGYLGEIVEKRIFKCPCCSYKFCYNCNRKCFCSHNFDKCVKSNQKKSDELSEALIHRCHECQVPFIKEHGISEGCNQMDCKCGASQCYACRKPIPTIGGHRCLGSKMKAQQIHERDVETAKLKYLLKNFI